MMALPVPDSDEIVYEVVEPIPFSKQEDHYSCVPRCLWMILQHFARKEGHTVHNYSVEEIMEIIGTNPEQATSYRGIENLNEDLKTRSNPILTFYPDANYDWARILKDLKEKIPIITYIKSHEALRLAHAVIIKRYDSELDEVTYIDPKDGVADCANEKTIYVGDFIELWENGFRTLMPVTVGEIYQTELKEILKKGDADDV